MSDIDERGMAVPKDISVDFSRRVWRERAATPGDYSICTMVTRPDEYREMHDSFVRLGFSGDGIEYLHVDNSGGNNLDAFQACNLFLAEARNERIILCHQDILLLDDGRERLDRLIAEVERLDPDWAVIGNAGAREDGTLTLRISDVMGEDQKIGGPFPAKVLTLDENFLVVRRCANLGVSHDLGGFHMYGPDICLMAQVLGLSCYAIDFHLLHKGQGHKDEGFYQSQRAFARKYGRLFRTRWLPTVTLSPVLLTGSRLARFLMRARRRLGIGSRFNRSAG